MIDKLPPAIPVNRHLVRHEGIEAHNLAFSVAYDLRIGIAP